MHPYDIYEDVIQLSLLLGERMRQELPDAIEPLTSARTRVYSACMYALVDGRYAVDVVASI